MPQVVPASRRARSWSRPAAVAVAVVLGVWTQAQQEPERWRDLVVAPEEANCPAYQSSHYSYYASGRGANENWLERRLAARLGAPRRQSFRTPYTGALMVSEMEKPCVGGARHPDCTPRRPSGRLSEVPYWYGPERYAAEIEHLVARKEAHDSGLCHAPRYLKRAFANDALNLTLATSPTNRAKSSHDGAEWSPPRNRCWWAVVNVLVRRKYSLTIDVAERDALDEVIESESCAESPWLAYLTLPDLDGLRPMPGAEPTMAIGGAPPALPVTLASAGAGNPAPAPEAASPLALYDDNANGRITCAEARAHDIAPVGADHPAYAYMNDRDGDGVVCE